MVTHARHRERGTSLLLAIIMTALLATAVALVLGDLNHRQHEFRREARVLTLTHLGDAAMAETLALLAADPAHPGLRPRIQGDGTIGSTVTPLDGRSLRVVARASFDGWRGVVDAKVVMGDGTPRVVEWSRRTEPAR
jgi:hypothetical protein